VEARSLNPNDVFLDTRYLHGFSGPHALELVDDLQQGKCDNRLSQIDCVLGHEFISSHGPYASVSTKSKLGAKTPFLTCRKIRKY
jgi:hypothetical protein